MIALPLSERRRRFARRGSALLLVFWLVAMMGGIVYSTVVVVNQDLEMTLSQKQAFRARQLAEMGINLAMNPVVKEYDWGLLNQGPGVAGTVPLPLQMPIEEGESVAVKIRGEGGAMNINMILQQGEASRPFLTKFFSVWGMSNDQADVLFDCLTDWVDADSSNQLHGLEKDDYIEMYGENTSYPFNRPFYKLEEMLLVPGFNELSSRLPDWRDFFTIYSAGKVDLNEADAKVMAAVALALEGTSDPQQDYPDKLVDAQELVQDRWGPDGIEETKDDIKFQSPEEMNSALASLGLDPTDPAVQTVFGINDQTVRIESVGTVGEFRKRVVLVVRNRTGTPQILLRDEIPLFGDSSPPPAE
jgi:general secretion pathway protein K